jgi:hypothetical protein
MKFVITECNRQEMKSNHFMPTAPSLSIELIASLVRVVLFLSGLRAPRAVLTELLLAVCPVPKAPTITDLSVDRIAGNCSAPESRRLGRKRGRSFSRIARKRT